MKGILEFSLPEEAEEYNDAINGSRYKYALDEVYEQVFRPSRKHGYSDLEINELLKNEKCKLLIEKLIDIYLEVKGDLD
jgi:hypothetical protein